jgi:hypothetical protein
LKGDARGRERYILIVEHAGKIPWPQWRRTVSSGGPEGDTFDNRACYRRLEIAGISVILEQLSEPGTLQVTITAAERELPPFVDVQVLQSLQMVTARPLYYSVLVRQGRHQNVVRCVGPVHRTATALLPQPVPISSPIADAPYWKAFDAVLDYLLRADPQNPYWNLFFDTLLVVMDASARHPSLFSLALSVAVEAILPRVRLSDDDGSTAQHAPNEMQSLLDHIDAWSGNERLKSRARGMLQSLPEWGTGDRLRMLEKKGVITIEERSAWTKLRNPVVHGKISSDDHDSEREKLIDIVVWMMYRIVLREAGYDGPLAKDDPT